MIFEQGHYLSQNHPDSLKKNIPMLFKKHLNLF